MSRSDRLQKRETSDTFRFCSSDRTHEAPDAESRGVRVRREFCAPVGSSWRRSLLAESIDKDRRPGSILICLPAFIRPRRVLSIGGNWTVSAPYTQYLTRINLRYHLRFRGTGPGQQARTIAQSQSVAEPSPPARLETAAR